MKISKYLRDLSLKASFNHFPQRFLSLMQTCKLKTLKLTQKMPSGDRSRGLQVNLSKYIPSTIEDLSLFWSDRAPKVVKFQHPFSIKHLENLQKLELGMPIAINTFKDIIKSIQDPSKLKSLRFNLRKQNWRDSIDDIGGFLRRCASLEVMNIKSSMIDFYSETGTMRLKELAIQQSVDEDEDLLTLGDLIQQQQNSLESLSLKLVVSSRRSFGPGSWFDPLFTKVKLLKNLKRLELRLIPYVSSERLSISASLAQVVAALDELEEIDLEEVSADFKSENNSLDEFCKALEQKHSKTLRSLKLLLNGCSCSEKLLQTLKRLPRLEHLTLRNFLIEKGSNFFAELRDIVCYRNRGLNSVIMRNAKIKDHKDNENFIRMLKGIIWKPTMKNFDYREVSLFYHHSCLERVKELNLDDVLKEVHHFEYLGICSALELDSLKWRALGMLGM